MLGSADFRRLLAALILTTLLAVSRSSAQFSVPDLTVFGSRYVLAFPGIAANSYDGRFPSPLSDRFFIYLYSAVPDNDVRITRRAVGKPSTVTLPAGSFKTVELDMGGAISDYGVPSNNTILVEAEHPVILYCYLATRYGGEAWTPAPVESWGTEYFAAALPGRILLNVYPVGLEGSGSAISAAPAQIVVVAAYDETEVTIVPNAPLRDGPPVQKIRLMAGQAYQVQSVVDTTTGETPPPQPDLGGSRITADKPIAVISGNTRNHVTDTARGITRNSFKNMLTEWLTPTDQHGTEFVYLPTADRCATRNDSADTTHGVRANEYVRIYGTSADTTIGAFHNPAIGIDDTVRIMSRSFSQVSINRFDSGIVFRTDRPAQLVMHSAAVTRYNDTTDYPGEKKGISYDTWSPYMVEMIPREEWSSFAPFIAPLYPPSIDHYVNVVADSSCIGRVTLRQGSVFGTYEEPFIFNRGAIPGSSLVWGTMQIIPGTDYSLHGDDSTVRFSGFVYGVRQGYEILRFTQYPEFEEGNAISYGYPLAPSRKVVAPGDELEIQTERLDCYALWCRLRIANPYPVGLRAVWLADGGTNTKLRFSKPTDSADILRQSAAEFIAHPIDSNRTATATIVVMDRTGKYWTIPYEFIPTPAMLAPADRLDFGPVRIGAGAMREVVITNPLDRNLRIEEARLRSGNSSFKIVATSEILPASLPPGASMKIAVRTIPDGERSFTDTLRFRFDCSSRSIPLTAYGVRPCIEMEDLDFGTVKVGEPKGARLRICNTGSGEVRLIDSTGKGVLTWLPKAFTILAADMDRLNGTILAPDSCVHVNVSFLPPDTGVYRTTARLWADTRQCRDTSVWRAAATAPKPSTGVERAEGSSIGLRQNIPNPFSGSTSIGFGLAAPCRVMISIYDRTGREVEKLVEGNLEAGTHRIVWDGAPYPAGIYICRLTSNEGTESIPMLLVK